MLQVVFVVLLMGFSTAMFLVMQRSDDPADNYGDDLSNMFLHLFWVLSLSARLNWDLQQPESI